MGSQIISKEQHEWIDKNSNIMVWKNQNEFTKVFNAIFNTNVKTQTLNEYCFRHNIKITTEHGFSDDVKVWIMNNYNSRVWKSRSAFLNELNETFNSNYSMNKLKSYFSVHKIHLCMQYYYSSIQEEWLKNNYNKYSTYVQMTHAYNETFNEERTTGMLRNKLCDLGLIPKCKSGNHQREYPVGTIKYNNGVPYIKVQLCNGANTSFEGGHGLKEPYWKSVKKKVWEENVGEVPDGYVVVCLNGDNNDTRLENLAIAQRRDMARMSKNGWWTENETLTKSGLDWCKLYYTAKDNGINLKEEN